MLPQFALELRNLTRLETFDFHLNLRLLLQIILILRRIAQRTKQRVFGRLLAAREHAMQRVVVPGRDRIKLMVMAARARDRQTQRSARHYINPVVNDVVLIVQEAAAQREKAHRRERAFVFAHRQTVSGDLLDQERKLKKSGLADYFHHIEIMSEKKEPDYKKLINHLDIQPSELMMIGNSLKSDILPVLNLGGHAIHIPYHVTWGHEAVEKNIDHPNFRELKTIRDILSHV